MTTRDVMLSWLLDRAGLRPRSIESYRSVIELHIVPVIGSVSADELSPVHIRSVLARVAALSRTAELCYIVCRSALADLPGHPMRGIVRPAHVQRSPDAWSDDQIAVYLAACSAHRHGLALSLGLLCGLRRGEICGLRWSDIDWTVGELIITNQRIRLSTGLLVDAPPKSRAGARPIPIPASLLARLRDARQLWGYVDGITPSGLDQAHRALVRRLGLPYIPLHGLRHSMATACVRHGCDLRSLQLVLGHASMSTTAMRYTHPDRAMLRAAIDAGPASCYTVDRVGTSLSGTDMSLTLNQGVQGSSP